MAGSHGGRNIRAHGVLNDEAAEPGEAGAGILHALGGIGRAFLVGQAEHTHSLALGGADDGEHFLAGGISKLTGVGGGALGEHHLGGTLHENDILAKYGGFTAGGHELVLRVEGQLGNGAELAAGIGIGYALVVQEHEHGALGHVAEHLAGFIEVGGGVGGHGLCEQREDGGGGALFIHAREIGLAHGHEVHGEGAGLVGADHSGSTDGFAGIHFAHQVVLFGHLAHAVGQAERHTHGQAFRHRYHDERDGNHEVGQNLICRSLGHPGGRFGGKNIAADEGAQTQAEEDGAGDDAFEPGAEAFFLHPGGGGDAHLGVAQQVTQHGVPDFERGGSNAGNEHAKEVPLRAGQHKLAQQGIMRHQGHEEEQGDGGAHYVDGLGKAFQLQVQRRLGAGFLGGGFGYFADFGLITHLGHADDAVAIGHEGAAQHHVARVGAGQGFFALGGNLEHGFGLTGEGGLVDAQGRGLEHHAVGGNFNTCFQGDDIAHHQLILGHHGVLAVAQHAHGGYIIHFVEDIELLVGAVFVHKAHRGGQEHGAHDADAFDGAVFARGKKHGNEGNDRSGNEDDDERVGKLAGQFHPPRVAAGRGHFVAAMGLAAFLYLGRGETGVNIGMRLHKIGGGYYSSFPIQKQALRRLERVGSFLLAAFFHDGSLIARWDLETRRPPQRSLRRSEM